MNKIYKVIWSKVKNQYVVVSELAHSNGKQSRTSRNSIRSRIAALVVCGAIAAFGVFSALPTSSAFAAGVGTMTDSKYIAFVTSDDGDNANNYYDGKTLNFDGHTYRCTSVRKPDGTYTNYWVREGYTIKLEEDTRFQGAEKSYVVRAYKSASADTGDIVQSYQNDIKESNIYTISGDKLHNTNTGVYAGGSNGYTPVKMSRTKENWWDKEYSYESDPWIQKNGEWKAADWNDFKSVTLNKTTGLYEYDGQVVNPENVYVIQRNDNGTTTNQIGVFVVDNQVYTGAVHGVNNEVLMTAIGKDGNYYTYWASEVYDPTATIGTMTVSAFNKRLSDIEADITTVHKDDIKGIEVKSAEGSSSNGGTIGLEINNDFNEDGSPTGGKYIPGTITIKNTDNSGKNGNDVKIQFGSIDEEGADVPKFTVDAGSKVEGLKDGSIANPNDTLTGIKINGEEYQLGGGKTYSAGKGIDIDENDKNKISVKLKEGENNLTVDDGGLSLKKDLTVDSVNAKGTTIDENGLTVGGTTYVSKEGLNAGNKVITNVSDGKLSATSTDAVNGSQLYATNQKVDAGWTATDGTNDIKVNPKDGTTTLKFAGDNKNITVTAAPNENAIQVALNKDISVENVTASGDVVVENANGTHSLEDIGERTAAITRVGKNTTVISDTLLINNIKNTDGSFVVDKDGNVAVGKKVVINADSGTITGLTNKDWNGDTDNESRAATEGQLKDIEARAYKGWTVSANGEAGKEVSSNGKVDFSNTDGNIVVNQNGTNLTFDLNDNVTLGKGDNQININGAPSDGEALVSIGSGANPKFMIGQNGEINANAKDTSFNFSSDGVAVNANGASTIMNGQSVIVGSVEGKGGVVINNNGSGTINGLSNLEWDKDNIVSGQAATEDQLQDVAIEAAKHTTVSGDENITVNHEEGSQNYQVTLDDTVYLGGNHTAENSNIILDGDNGTINVTNVKESHGYGPGRTTTNEFTFDNNGATFTNITEKGHHDPVESSTNINGGTIKTDTVKGLSNTTINYEGFATEGKAATEEQLKQAAAASKTTLSDGVNTTVTSNDNTPDGHVDYQVNLDDNVYLGGDNTPENSNIKLDGENGIIGVGSTIALDGKDGRAVIGGVNIATEADEETGKPVSTVKVNGNVITTNADGTEKYNLNKIGKNTEAIYGTKVNGEYLTTVTGTLAATTIQNTSAKFRVDESGNVAAGKVIINATGDISGLSNTTWDGTTNNPSRAATEGQLKAVSDDVNAGWIATDNSGKEIKVNPDNNKLNFAGDNKNITVTATTDEETKENSINVKLSDNLDVVNVKASNDVVTTNADGTEKYSLNKIGKNTEAIYGTKVNGEYLTTVTGKLAATTIQNTSAKFRVDESGNVAAGKVIINATGDISGLSNTTWNGTTNNPSRAATEGQLKAVSDDVNAGWIATDNSGKEVAVNPDNNKLNFAGDDNITVTATTDENNNNAINVKLNDNITLGDGQSAITLNGSPQNSDDPALSVGTDKFVVAQDGSLSVSDKFNVDAETGNIYAANNSGSAIMMNDDSVALNAGGNGIVASDEGILLNTNGINEDIKLVTKGTSVSVDSNGTTFTNTNTNETTNIDGGTINVGDRLMVEEDGSIYATNNNGSTVMINDNGVALNSEGNGVVVSGEGITLNANGSAVTVDRFNGTTFTNTNTGETTNINGGTITTDTVKGLSNTTWDAQNPNAYANSDKAATEAQLQKAAAASKTTVSAGDNIKVDPTPNNDGHIDYKVSLDDNITLGDKENAININGTDGTLKIGNGANAIKMDGVNGTLNIGSKFSVAEDGTVLSDGDVIANADGGEKYSLTELGKYAVKYDKTAFDNDTPTITLASGSDNKGTRIRNVADGLETKDAVNLGQLQSTEKHIATNVTANGETPEFNGAYAVGEDGKITLTEVNGAGKETGNKVVLSNIASMDALKAVEATASAGWTAKAGDNDAEIKVTPGSTLNFEDDGNITVSATSDSNELKFGLNDDITLGNPVVNNPEGERSFTINTTDPEGYIPESYKEGNSEGNSGAEFIKENGGFMLFATDTDGHGVFGVTAKGTAWAKDFKTYTTDIYGNSTQYSLNDIGDIVTQMAAYYDEDTKKSYTVFSHYLNEADKENPFEVVGDDGKVDTDTRDIPLALRDDGAVLIGATVEGDSFTETGIRINENDSQMITGLSNTTWTPTVNKRIRDGETPANAAATVGQLNDLYGYTVGYALDGNNKPNYNIVNLAGETYSYNKENPVNSKGTLVTNVAYAATSGDYDGSAAVNVDLLKDTIAGVEKGTSADIGDLDYGSVTGTNINSGTDNVTTAIGKLDNKVGNLQYEAVTGTDIKNGQDVTTAIGKVNNKVGDLVYSKFENDTTSIQDGDSVTEAIGKLNNSINGVTQDVVNNSISGGHVDESGKVVLEKGEGENKSEVTTGIQLTDSEVSGVTLEKDTETGKNVLTITSTDKYDKNKTTSVSVSGLEIASTDDIKDVTGVTSSEDLKDAYKDADKDGNATTEYITDSETMVDADVALDHAIQDVASTSYANDMALSNRIDNVEKRLGDVEERIDKVGAMSAAIANLRTMGYDPEAPTEIAVGVGQYKSETGLAIGIFHYPNQDFMLSASLSTSGDEVMGGIGATWRIGRKTAAEKAKDEEKRILAKAEEIKQAAKRAEVKAQADRHAKLLAEREAKGEPIRPIEKQVEQA